MKNNIGKFINRNNNKPDVDSDLIKGRKLANQESLAMMFQDVVFDEESFEKAIEKYVK